MGKRGPDGPAAYYVPCDAIAAVSGKRVELSVEARVAAERWPAEPLWVLQARGGLGLAASAGKGANDAYSHRDSSGLPHSDR